MYNGLKVLMIYQRKGGVGKTFLAVTLAYMLANGGVDGKGKKKRVLLLDFDSQQDASRALLNMTPIPGSDEQAPPLHPFAGKIDDPDWSGINTSSDILFGVPVYEYPTGFDNISILPSEGNVDRITAVSNDMSEVVPAIKTLLGDWFSIPELAEDYDIIIVDNPPSKTPVTSALLGVATDVLIPTEISHDSIEGARALLERIETENETREAPLNVVGIVPNNVPTKSRQTQKDKMGMELLFQEGAKTRDHMTPFSIYHRDAYRSFVRPNLDPTHFAYVSNRFTEKEMGKLYKHVFKGIWG